MADLAKRQPRRVLDLIERFRPETHERPVGHSLVALAELDDIPGLELEERIHAFHNRGLPLGNLGKMLPAHLLVWLPTAYSSY